MTTPTRRSPLRFYLGFLLVTLAIAGGLSYLASSSPDGLDSVTLEGCTLSAEGEPEGGTCIAQNAQDHDLAGSPLSDYAVGGADGSVGLAGIVGVLVTLAGAGGLFWLLRTRR